MARLMLDRYIYTYMHNKMMCTESIYSHKNSRLGSYYMFAVILYYLLYSLNNSLYTCKFIPCSVKQVFDVYIEHTCFLVCHFSKFNFVTDQICLSLPIRGLVDNIQSSWQSFVFLHMFFFSVL